MTWDSFTRIDVNEECQRECRHDADGSSCPAADFIMEDVQQKVESVEGVKSVNINLVFEPQWTRT